MSGSRDDRTSTDEEMARRDQKLRKKKNTRLQTGGTAKSRERMAEVGKKRLSREGREIKKVTS